MTGSEHREEMVDGKGNWEETVGYREDVGES